MTEALQLELVNNAFGGLEVGEPVPVPEFAGRQPKWEEIKKGQLLMYYTPKAEYAYEKCVVLEVFDTFFTMGHPKPQTRYVITRKVFAEDAIKFVWAYQDGEILKSSISRGILRPWHKKYNRYAAEKKWRLF